MIYEITPGDVYDGDTLSANINLGFGIWMMNKRIKIL